MDALPASAGGDGIRGFERPRAQLHQPRIQIPVAERLTFTVALSDHQIRERLLAAIAAENIGGAGELPVAHLTQPAGQGVVPETLFRFFQQTEVVEYALPD